MLRYIVGGNPLFDSRVSRRVFLGSAVAASCGVAAAGDDWTALFDGRSLDGWRPSENKSSWTVVDGMLSANGPRSHLFYEGPVHGADFRNFELEVELITRPQCNSGVYFHTAYQETGFPEKGFEIQINNTALGDGGYLERKKTASLYGLRNMYKQLVPDEKPFQVRVAVRGKNVQIRLNGQLLVDYVEPTPPVIPAGGEKQRFLDHGTFALQCHNDGSKAMYRSARVRPLPDNLPAYIGPAPVADAVFREVIDIGRHNVPMVDYHVFLRDGMTLEDALRKSRADGIQYGITADAAAFRRDVEAARWLSPLMGKPVFFAIATADGEWTRKVTFATARQFDYVVGDGRSAKRLVLAPADPQVFVDQLVDRTVKRLNTEPIDIYSHLTYLPPAFQADAELLWTQARMTRLIEALVRNQVAIELNSVDRLPGRRFIETARDAGCKFAFGTGNGTAAELQRCEYGLAMTEVCKLDWHHFFAPGAWWKKAVERRWPAAG